MQSGNGVIAAIMKQQRETGNVCTRILHGAPMMKIKRALDTGV